MNTQAIRSSIAAASTVVLALGLAGCGGGSAAAKDAASAAFDACTTGGDENGLLRLDGTSVHLEVVGENAKALAAFNSADFSGDVADWDASGLGITLALMSAGECLVEVTAYPGTTEQLRDGDTWTGWSLSASEGPGAEARLTFTASNEAKVADREAS